MNKPKIVRITTVPISLSVLLKGQLRFIKSNNFDVIAISSPGGDLKKIEENEKIRVIALPMTRKITPFQDFVSVINLYKILKNENPLIVHSHTPKAGIVSMISSWLAGVPIRLHTVAGLPLLESKGFKRFLLLYVERLTYFFATRVYTNSKGLLNIILEYKLVKPSKIGIIANGSSNGIDLLEFSPFNIDSKKINNLKSKLSIKVQDFVFVFVGRLVRDKGVDDLVLAFSSLIDICKSRSMPLPKLLLVGNYELDIDPLLIETLQEIKCNNNIINVGFVDNVKPYFSISNVLVFPSYREGFPNVVLQAGAMGLPSIVTDINGCNEIIKNNVNGLLVPPKRPDIILDTMFLLLNDSLLYQNLKSNSRSLILERFQQQTVWDSLLEEYKSLIKF
jgi:glycosyltransferase involved in cell wall biosynthesis